MTCRYYSRDITPAILEALDNMPVVVVTGLRQSGKSTFLQNEKKLQKRRYITFDDFTYLEAAKNNPKELLLSSNKPITIDEVQKCPDILTEIKSIVDKKRVAGQFLLSGSANLSMLKSITETLAGRSVYFNLYPFNRREILKTTDTVPFIKNFFFTQIIKDTNKIKPIRPDEVIIGGMPSVCLKEVKNSKIWFMGYEQTYLERDIRQFSQITDTASFRRLLTLTSLRTSQILSISQLARDSILNSVTASRYLSLFEVSFILKKLIPFLGNRASRLIKSPKIYTSDSGLACYLAGVRDFKSKATENLKGSFFETYVAQNFFSIIDSKWQDANIYYWNVQGRFEVDFIIECENECIAIEIKSSSKWDEKSLSGLKAFLSRTDQCKFGILAYNGKDIVKLGEKLWALPLGLLLS